MPGNGFVHLHVHSHYSLLDGACSVDGLLDSTQAAGMKAVAITDHGNLFGALEFYRVARERGVKPIIGIEAYLAPKSRFDKTRSESQEVYYHMLLLAKDATGYRNLVKLASAAYTEGFYYRPRVDKELLRRHGEGLIATSGCLQGEVNQLLLAGDEDGARTALREYREIFGPENYFLEVQDHGIADQRRLNPMVRALGKETRTPLVATNDLHYLSRDGAHAHDALLCISTGKLMADPDRWRFDGSEFWFKGEADMRAVLPDYHDAIDRTVEIADRCNLEIPLGKARFPEYRHDRGIPNPQLLRQLCTEGLTRRYGAKPAKEARDRLEHELGVIERLGFVNYFLVVWDLIHHARQDGIPVGPGRGSSAGSLVAYCLEITNVDPLRFDLLFDRFLNADRHEPPDIDIDICQAGRGRVIEYVRRRYGEANVAQIITFGTLAARRVVRDVGRVLDIPLAEVDAIAKLIPAGPGVTLEKALAETPELAERVQADARARELIEISRKLEGLARNAGTHAAGVVISDRPLQEEVPVYLANDEVSTQYQMNDVGALGLLKMDLLGLETLTALEEVRRLVATTRGEAPTLPMAELDDPAVYALLQRGDATGVFQLESEGMRSLLLRLKPDRFEDLIAVLALYRPGPLGSGMVDSYVRRKHGEEPLAYLHPALEPLLAETNGVILYQEQVMRIANRLGGFTLSQADTLRKAMGKKKPEVMAKFKAQFIEGAAKNKIPADIADQIWGQMEFFSGYGFNKCVVGETRVVDARSGEVTTVEDLFRHRRPFTVSALGDDWRLRPRRVAAVAANGRKRVYAMRTAQGRELVATANHPIRTLHAWTHLSALRPGDRVAAARALAIPGACRWARHEIVLCAALLSEGNTCHPSALAVYNTSREYVADVTAAAERFPHTSSRVTRRRGVFEVSLTTGRDARFRPGQIPWNAPPSEGSLALRPLAFPTRSGAFRWAGELGLLGHRAPHKRVPPGVFTLGEPAIRLFLGRLWSGDGFIANSTQAVPFYATASSGLAEDVRTLLLRVGIPSGVDRKRFRVGKRVFTGFTVHIIGDGTAERFASVLGPHLVGRGTGLAHLRRHLARTARGRTSKDTIPASVRRWVDDERRRAGLTWRELERASDVSVKELVGRGSHTKRGFRRTTIARLARFFDSRVLSAVAASDIFWDTVVSVKARGLADTYDLTVADDHNFTLADGLVVHNSHSTAYALISYQTAWCKVKFPAEFMAAMLTIKSDDLDKIADFANDCRHAGLEILPPDINRSDARFRVEGTKIRYGLAAVKGVGERAVEAIVAARKARGTFASLYDIPESVDQGLVNRNVLDALVKCGACDALGPRAALSAALDDALAVGATAADARRRGQADLFGGGATPPPPPLPAVAEWPEAQRLADEKALTGLYHSSHPLARYATVFDRFTTARAATLAEKEQGAEVVAGGMVRALRKTVTKTGKTPGQRMALFEIEDLTGKMKAVIFPRDYERAQLFLVPDKIVVVRARVDKSRDEPSLKVSEVIPIERARERLCTKVVVRIAETDATDERLRALGGIIRDAGGDVPVFIRFVTADGAETTVRAGHAYTVNPSEKFDAACRQLLGEGHIEYR